MLMKWFQRDEPQPKVDNPFEVTEESALHEDERPKIGVVINLVGMSAEDQKLSQEAYGGRLKYTPFSDSTKFF